MKGMRLRLNDVEREYLLRLVAADNKMHEQMISKAVITLIKKLQGENES